MELPCLPKVNPMKKAIKVVLGIVGVLAVVVGGTYVWASTKDKALLARTIETHSVDFPIPFPLTDAEIAEVAQADGNGDGHAEVDLDAIAMARAVDRGDHLVHARYGCVECHGQDFGGGVMVDDPILGRLLGANITAGPGGRTAGYTAADWDRIVRHGVRPDGLPAAMPSSDFQRMSDQELSDVVAYIRSQPVVDNAVPPVTLGPLGKILMATGKLPLAADLITDHQRPHAVEPPEAAADATFGEHLAGVCAGCHGESFAGGPVPGGDPSWPPAADLTPAGNLGAWSEEQFVRALRTATRPDGTELLPPMSLMTGYAQRMTDTEISALYKYFRSLPPTATPR
jgi:mono/diheme cytochrome c family protein